MRLISKALGSAALLCAVAGAASASVSVLTFSVTNNTTNAWTSVLFEIKAPLAASYDPLALALVLFDSDLNRHSTNRADTTLTLNESAKQIRFSFGELTRMTPGQTSTFTVTVDNPEDSAFRIVRSVTNVPTPGAVSLAGLAGLVAVRRRRA